MTGLIPVICAIAVLGALGGVGNCLIMGEFVLPQFDHQTRVWRPGWVGNVVVGAIAALVVGGLYGPLARIEINTPTNDIKMAVAEFAGAIVVGLGGGNILTQLSQRQAERLARSNLAASLQTFANLESQKEGKQ